MAKESDKSKLTLVKEAQEEVQNAVVEKRIGLLESLEELTSIGGNENIKDTVLRLTEHFKAPGIPQPFLYTVGADADVSKAIKDLVAEGKLVRSGKKGKAVFTAVIGK